ncbi:hypothetical protein [Nocardia heshunensis]
MIVIIGLVILIAAVVVGLAGVLANGGSTHALTDNFAVFGYHVTGSTGLLFLYGIVVGGIGLAGLFILLAGARATARRGAGARRELEASRRELEASRQHAAVTNPRLAAPIPAGTPPPGVPTQYTGTTDAAVGEPVTFSPPVVDGPGRSAGPMSTGRPQSDSRR